jgi:hypothetical protein
MPIQFRCENAGCGGRLRVPDGAAGKRAKCPRCGNVQRVPTAEPAPVVAEVAEAEPYENHVIHEAERPRRARLEDEPDEYAEDRPRRRREDDEDDDPRRRLRGRGPEQLTCPRCAAPVSAGDRECESCGYDLDPEALKKELGRLLWTRSLFQGLMFFFVVPGVVMTAISFLLYYSDYPLVPWVYVFLAVGSVLTLLGVALGAPHKRFNLAWMLLGLLHLFGLIILAGLLDVKRQRARRIRQILRADWEAEGHGRGARPPLARGGFPFSLLLGLFGLLAAGGIVAAFRLFFVDP